MNETIWAGIQSAQGSTGVEMRRDRGMFVRRKKSECFDHEQVVSRKSWSVGPWGRGGVR